MSEHFAPPPESGSRPQQQTTSSGIDPHVAGLLTYLVGWITGLVFFLIEKEHREVRFHAAQSILLSVGLIVVWVALSVLSLIPVLGLLFVVIWVVLGVASLALWIYLLVQGYQLRHVRLPVVGVMAERWAAS